MMGSHGQEIHTHNATSYVLVQDASQGTTEMRSFMLVHLVK